MNDLVLDQHTGAGRSPIDDDWTGPATGRHAFNEDAVLTPIFHALTHGGWRRRQQEPVLPAATRPADPVDAFRRDPLTAPIPVQAIVPAPSREWQPGRRRGDGTPVAGGRHHRRREPVGSYA